VIIKITIAVYCLHSAKSTTDHNGSTTSDLDRR